MVLGTLQQNDRNKKWQISISEKLGNVRMGEKHTEIY